MNYEIIRIILSKRSEQEKSKKILLFVIDQDIFPKDIIGLIAEYWSYAESVSKFVPSLICPASNEFYRKPYVCANDSKDLVVYEQKVFDKYNVPCIQLPGITAALEFLRDSECELKIVAEQKSDLEQGIHSSKHNEFIQSLYHEPLSQINFFSELKFKIEEAKKIKRDGIDLAVVIQNYHYPLIIKKRPETRFALEKKYWSFLVSNYSRIIIYHSISKNRWLMIPALGNMINKYLIIEASMKYMSAMQLTHSFSIRGIKKMKGLVVNPFFITIAMMNDFFWEMQQAENVYNQLFYSIAPALSKIMLVPASIVGFFINVPETLTCLDIYYSEEKEQDEYKQQITYSKTAKALLCVSILNSAWMVYDICSMENRHGYFITMLQLFSLIDFGISIPRLLLSSRQTAREFKEVCECPQKLIESAHDEEGFRESFCTTLTQRVSRLSSGIIYGVFRYLVHNDPIRGVIAGIAAFNESSILNVIRWSPRMFRRFPTELYQPEQKTVLEVRVEEPEVLNTPETRILV